MDEKSSTQGLDAFAPLTLSPAASRDCIIMAKRFTDTEKWHRPWFRHLSIENKLLWNYIVDHCDIAGVWYKDLEMAGFCIGYLFLEETVLREFEKQIEPLGNGSKWRIKDFIEFQYGALIPNNNFHRSVMALLEKHEIKISGADQGLNSPSLAPQDKDIDKDNTNTAFKGGANRIHYDRFYANYPKHEGKEDGWKAWKVLKPDEELQIIIVEAIEKQKKTIWAGKEKKYIPLPATWLRGKRWEDDTNMVSTSSSYQGKNVQ